ncbi:Afadin and alpha-actinin-binding-domain-containing protein [Boletus edulis BED1]|uniref:Afadin and alpha-actinin-binding-domain-containing protein n=1 Tax=Boletus edulis BED1 TaxID=1328754 RepID=A0AAD4GJG3_BOLED|nr:Afadin and alpha-actinin-binding-domain-containing protein [Boletus edulis BED1]
MTNVHWALDVSVSDFGSPFDTTTTTTSCSSTTSFQYINSQLVAHGFTRSPGLPLEGISGENMECLTKCLLAMLSQRVTDMSRAEELSTKLRTLSYDHERLMGMHRSSTEKTLNAEREVNMYKSRLATAARSLQSSESSHKQTTAELQRTRTLLQALRATHAAELKKREKEIERMVEKWTKLVDSQSKSSTTSPGMVIRGANAEVASGMELLGKGKGYLEVALEHADSSRKELLDETTRLRRLILVSANRLQSMIHEMRTLASIRSEEASFFHCSSTEPASFDHDALFPLTPINAADDKMLSLFASANDAISVLSKHLSDRLNTAHSEPSGQLLEADSDSEDCKCLRAVIEKLQNELDEAKQLHETHATETRELLNQLAYQGTQRASMDGLMIASELDAEHDQLDRIRKELEDERKKFTHAAVKLGNEKSAFESERIKFMEEKRSWQVQQMLSEHPPTPAPVSLTPDVPPSPGLAAHLPEVMKSPRKSPRKQKVVGKSSNSRKTRVSRRSSTFSILPPTNVEPAYETEVIPIVVSPSKQQTNNKPPTLTKSILPTSFVLPPPSPRTSLPPPDPPAEDSSSAPSSPPLPNPIPTIVEPNPAPAPMPKPAPAPALSRTPPPFRRPFPMAKPMAARMTHAYSPVKPSPLSRILMLADSPDSPESDPLHNVDGKDTTPTGCPVLAATVAAAAVAKSDDDDSPLREKKSERNVVQAKQREKTDTKKRSSKERNKVREEPAAPAAASKPKTIGAGEKENRDKQSRRRSPPTLEAPATKPPSTYTTSKPEVGAKPTTKVPAKLPIGKGGARRVPIGSAEAAPLPGWRG